MFQGDYTMIQQELRYLKREVKRITYIILREMFNDFSIFNRFSELKKSGAGIKIHGSYYNADYYNDLLQEANTDFIKGLCRLYSIKHSTFLQKCKTMKDSFEIASVKFHATRLRNAYCKTGRTKINKEIHDRLKKMRKDTKL